MILELLEYGYNDHIEIGIDENTMNTIINEFKDLLEKDDTLPEHFLEILQNNGIEIS